MLNDKLNRHGKFPPAIVAPPTMRYHPTRYYGTFASGEAVTGKCIVPSCIAPVLCIYYHN